MPCQSYTNEEIISDQSRRIDEMARRLCRAMEVLEKNDLLDNKRITSDMRAWWQNHKEKDEQAKVAKAEKIMRKKVAKKALAKLTKKERDALGV